MKRKHETIEWVVRHHLCTGCGVCAGICPREALEMTVDERKGCYVPRIDVERCTRCGLCYEVCPGAEVDFKGFSAALFGDVPTSAGGHRREACGRGLAARKADPFETGAYRSLCAGVTGVPEDPSGPVDPDRKGLDNHHASPMVKVMALLISRTVGPKETTSTNWQ